MTQPSYPSWFPRALAVARFADENGLEIHEADWLLWCKDHYPKLHQIPPASRRYLELLYAKSQAAVATRRKRIANVPRP